jgi:hypothetical protein
LRAARKASYTLTGTLFMAWRRENTGHSQKRGFGLSTQVDVAEDLGAYVRAGWNDGRLSYATERILETFYSFSLAKKTWLSLGFQRIANPGYNRDRGPADFLSVRVHAEM